MHSLVEELTLILLDRRMMLATAESCTGGLIGASMTDRGGSSAVYERGFITYSNDAKMELLGVKSETLAAHGAVSEQTAREMADGALAHSRAHVSVSVTGIAGPTGGTADKPVGLVYMGIAVRGEQTLVHKYIFEGDRMSIRQATVEAALERLIERLGSKIA